MKAADMHCDTILEIYEKRQAGEACGILKNGLHIDLEKLKKGDIFYRILLFLSI